jgi:hypothetical protein
LFIYYLNVHMMDLHAIARLNYLFCMSAAHTPPVGGAIPRQSRCLVIALCVGPSQSAKPLLVFLFW